ncbi:hypothetical protein DJ568_11885 [Mucilaginibacter hurinus]|uniref:LruC domain-containing protein n=1 Tax=Mucilaginibacter hurinus TaxID=2201324 RepID=A0A367GM16_9SPHI|nr:LruC domain-containing protein [Mucilaginibacter hurinus]RCH54517.1 hypothetical protein DJ568_11885 [Mucilaginibacter hurinus]
MKQLFTFALFLGIAGVASCKKDSPLNGDNKPPVVEAGKIAPDGFTFKTAKDIVVNVTLLTNTNQPLSGVKVNIYDPANVTNGSAIYSGFTDKAGKLTATVSVAAHLKQLIIDPLSAGLLRYATAAINGNATTIVIGGEAGFGGDVVITSYAAGKNNPSTASLKTFAVSPISFSYPSPYKNTKDAVYDDKNYPLDLGRPKYLLEQGDAISAALLKTVNASLPESDPLPVTHPEYLESSVTSTLNLVKKSDVWITYISEGAGNRNTLAYYTYATGSKPKQEKDIKNAKYVFPNASHAGSGGALQSGDKIKLGTFDAGISIGFILIGNAWTGSGVDLEKPRYFSDDALNPEEKASEKKHTVVLWDKLHKLFLIGFEDLPRNGGSDNDFNDLVFYITSNPVEGISNEGVPNTDPGDDQDGDGVNDDKDEFPTDATKAYTSYFPSKDAYAQVAFEDNWPAKGDYDLNDMVIDYRYKFIKNAKNEVVTLTGEFVPKAAGASFKNGFGVELPISASLVKTVTGQKAISNYIAFASNGVEAGQDKAVIVPFDNHDAVLRYADGSFLVNTKMNKDKVAGTSTTVEVTFTAPVAEESLKPSAFNPFLISNVTVNKRAIEIHLPGFTPTKLADKKYFNTKDDTSKPGEGRYYLSKENGPWAIAYNTSIIYPIEEANINKAYLHFDEWALSGGTAYADWYSNTSAGYRDNKFLYLK